MARIGRAALWGAIFLMLIGIFRKTDFYSLLKDFQELIKEKWKNFILFFVIAGVLANTPLDQIILDYCFKIFNKKAWIKFILHCAKKVVDYGSEVYISVLYAALIFSEQINQEGLSAWLGHQVWNLIQGYFLYLINTVFLSGARPEHHITSHWFRTPYFHYFYAVSGHAFLGAFPFITLANGFSSHFIKVPLYLLALLPGLSRLQTNSHYPSQVLLGWSFAFMTGIRLRVGSEATIAAENNIRVEQQLGVGPAGIAALGGFFLRKVSSCISYIKDVLGAEQPENTEANSMVELQAIETQDMESLPLTNAAPQSSNYLGWAFSYIKSACGRSDPELQPLLNVRP